MEIYVVQPGDTLTSIAQKYNITTDKLINDNGIKIPYQLVVGQTLVIVYPEQVYIVKEGDTLGGIAESHGVTVVQLLKNNPWLSSRQYIYPGETIVISFNNNLGTVLTAGYTYPYIRNETLKMTLPYLTYLLIFNYTVTSSGEFLGGDEDIAVIETALLYGTESTMVVTAFSQTGEIRLPAVFALLGSEQLQDEIIMEILLILREKGYEGVNLAFQFIREATQQLYLNFLKKVADSLHPEGYSVFLTINPGLSYNGTEVTFERINYSSFSDIADGILFLSYDWATIDRPPVPISIITESSLLDYIVAQVPLEKIRIEVPTLGYDWQLPYVEGRTKANALNFDSVLALAGEAGATIQYDENSLSAYFNYADIDGRQHIVWFKDARSIDSSIKILQSYGIKGIGIWNIMNFFSQLWLVINTQYQIETENP